MSLPAAPMISLTVALEARYTLYPRNAPPHEVRAVDFVTGNHTNILAPGELLRSIQLPASARPSGLHSAMPRSPISGDQRR
jgi:CO/xanthine dehydrogenase FAD-binding subunit